jgi:hypothetical protein
MPRPRRKNFTVAHHPAERARKALQAKVYADIVRHVAD